VAQFSVGGNNGRRLQELRGAGGVTDRTRRTLQKSVLLAERIHRHRQQHQWSADLEA
jgi:hypothetical protein